jgi:hypothetical protein
MKYQADPDEWWPVYLLEDWKDQDKDGPDIIDVPEYLADEHRAALKKLQETNDKIYKLVAESRKRKQRFLT